MSGFELGYLIVLLLLAAVVFINSMIITVRGWKQQIEKRNNHKFDKKWKSFLWLILPLNALTADKKLSKKNKLDKENDIRNS